MQPSGTEAASATQLKSEQRLDVNFLLLGHGEILNQLVLDTEFFAQWASDWMNYCQPRATIVTPTAKCFGKVEDVCRRPKRMNSRIQVRNRGSSETRDHCILLLETTRPSVISGWRKPETLIYLGLVIKHLRYKWSHQGTGDQSQRCILCWHQWKSMGESQNQHLP